MGYQCDSFLNKAFVVEGQNQALTKERKFQMLGELTIQEVEWWGNALKRPLNTPTGGCK